MERWEWIYPGRREWPGALDDVAKAPPASTEIRLISGARNINLLPRYKDLRSLWCFDIEAESFDAICNCDTLESLYLDNVKVESFYSLKKLPQLKVLGVERCSRVTSLVDFGNLDQLGGLAISHFQNVHEIEPLARLQNLRALAVEGSMWKAMNVKTLKPLGCLTNLESLSLGNLRVEDQSLRPLASLSGLKQLNVTRFYSMEEFVSLSQKLTGANCCWFRPYVDMGPSIKCKVCAKPTMVMLSGKGKPTLCSKCDKEKLSGHIRKWEEAVAKAKCSG